MDVIKQTRPRTPGDLIAMELDQNYCRETVMAKGAVGADLLIDHFTVLGQITLGALSAVAVAKGGNAGNGVFTLANTVVAPAAAVGVWKVVIFAAVANAGDFQVFDPGGNLDGEGKVGVAYAGSIKFTLADGAADFVVEDEFDVTVTEAAPSDLYVPLNFAAVDGSQNAKAITIRRHIVPVGVNTPIDVIARGPTIVRQEEMILPVGATNDQAAEVYAQLAALGVLCRPSG